MNYVRSAAQDGPALSFRGETPPIPSLHSISQNFRDGHGVNSAETGDAGRERSTAVVMARQVMRSLDRCSSALMTMATDMNPSRLSTLAKQIGDRTAVDMDATNVGGRMPDLLKLYALLDKEMVTRQRLEVELRDTGLLLQQMRSELVRIQAHALRVEQVAYQDALTGLPNRASFEIHSRQALSKHAPHLTSFGLMYIDLDGFKTVNDSHGHGVGDELLRIIGSRLVHSVRMADSVSRHGGDEFLCLLMDVEDETQIAAIAEKLFLTVSSPCQLGALSLSITPSIGIALYPKDGTTVDVLLQRADRAMFWAKKHHLRHAFYDQVPAYGRPRQLDGVRGMVDPPLPTWPPLSESSLVMLDKQKP